MDHQPVETEPPECDECGKRCQNAWRFALCVECMTKIMGPPQVEDPPLGR